MKYLRIKNWKKHQHYSDRRPPWIKLHNSLFDDYEFQQLTDIQRWHLVAIWLLSSRSTAFHADGDPLIPEDEKYITRQTGMNGKIDLNSLIIAGFLIRYQDDSNTQAKCSPETEAYRSKEETETETEKPRENGFAAEMMSQMWNEAIVYFGKDDPGIRIPRVEKLTDKRRKKCELRIRACGLNQNKWEGVLNSIHGSPFLSGKTKTEKHPNWKATFDWVIEKDENVMKIIEGAYQ